jgi:hypothetical protein
VRIPVEDVIAALREAVSSEVVNRTRIQIDALDQALSRFEATIQQAAASSADRAAAGNKPLSGGGVDVEDVDDETKRHPGQATRVRADPGL